MRSIGAAMKKWIALATLAMVAWALLPLSARAQEPQVRLFNSTPFPLLVNGEKAFGSPTIAKPGDLVCVSTAIGYQGEGDRLVFSGWSHGRQEECVRFNQAGDYNVLYTPEVLVQIRSRVKEHRKSLWVPRGSLTRLVVPEQVAERPGVQWRFEEWDGGETPFQPKNAVAPLRPTIIEVKWRKEYYLAVEGPAGVSVAGAGWYPEGGAATLRAAPEVDGSSRSERFKFTQWDGGGGATSITSPQSPTTAIRMDDTYTVRANYRKEFLVIVRNHQGVTNRTWVAAGGELTVETPAIVEVAPERERLVFKAWEGADLKSAKGVVEVGRPLELNAAYTREFMVKINAPYGAAGSGWQAEGTTATIQVPRNPGGILFLQKSFDGFPGHPGRDTTLRVPVNGPLTVTASYKTKVDYKMLGIILALLTVAGVIYLFTQKRVRQILSRVLKEQT